MKRICLFFLGLVLLTQTPTRLFADDTAATAAAIAERQDAAERYNRLSAQIEDLMNANAAMQKRLSALEQQVGALRDASERANANTTQYAAREDVKQLSESVTRTIKELDEKRLSDNQKIVAALEEFKKALKNAPVPASIPREVTSPRSNPVVTNDAATGDTTPRVGFNHVVAKGEYLTTIISAYNKELKEKGVKGKITLDSVLKANPGLDPNRMYVGQKLFLPKPAE